MRRTIFGLSPRAAGFAFVVALVAVAGVVQALFPGSPAGDRAATTATVERSEKAEQLLRRGKELEARGQKSSAARFYRQVIEKYGETGHARAAAERLEAMGR